jgi:aspartate/methionine/tyrosine aminotransferase
MQHPTHAVTSKIQHTPYVVQGGFFVWMNLKNALQIESYEREADMFHGMFDKAKLVLIPGEVCHAKEPGFYRICIAAHPPEAMHDFIARLKYFIDQYKTRNEKQNWATQNFMLNAGFGTRVNK